MEAYFNWIDRAEDWQWAGDVLGRADTISAALYQQEEPRWALSFGSACMRVDDLTVSSTHYDRLLGTLIMAKYWMERSAALNKGVEQTR